MQRIKVTVYGALARKVRDMPSSGLENGRLVVLPATINAFAFNGTNGSGGVLVPPCHRLRRRQGLHRRAGGLR
ncbi:hypothetical protein [Nocardiopsis dassonvillei]|uniref:hypothetical protein n=1 Tax=Nocardiopsis dassonvillei TaxID=2014 RepID=UPI00157BBCD3|nr:hypothetical protein [Nocardiopsis dassonvillei]